MKTSNLKFRSVKWSALFQPLKSEIFTLPRARSPWLQFLHFLWTIYQTFRTTTVMRWRFLYSFFAAWIVEALSLLKKLKSSFSKSESSYLGSLIRLMSLHQKLLGRFNLLSTICSIIKSSLCPLKISRHTAISKTLTNIFQIKLNTARSWALGAIEQTKSEQCSILQPAIFIFKPQKC